MKKRALFDRLSTHAAKARKSAQQKPMLRLLGGRGAATVALGAALSIGGITDVIGDSHLLVRKDLDAVRVVRQHGEQETVVANLEHGFTGNTVFKLSRALPDRYVTRELALFDDSWIPDLSDIELPKGLAPQTKRDLIHEELAKFNDAIRAEFFSDAMPYGDLIHEKAKKYDVDPLLVAAVIEQESRFRTRAKSHVGARGLMQLMPRTGRWMGARDLYNPEQNVDAGVKYIKYLEKRFNGNIRKTIAAYNAGEGNVKRYGGIPPFRETQQYVRKVLKNYDKRSKELEKFEKEQLRTTGGSVPEADGTLTLR